MSAVAYLSSRLLNLPHANVAHWLFWTALVALFYVYVGYPLLLAVIAGLRRRPAVEAGYSPRLTVLIPAYNEELSIGRKIEDTLALEYPSDLLEVLIVSDGSGDRTDAIVQRFDDPRVRLVRVPSQKGKTHAQNLGVQHATGEIIVFSDATAIYHSKALLYLAAAYRDPSVGAVSGRYHYFRPRGGSPTTVGSIAFWNYENFIKKLQSHISTLTGCSGCIYSIRKNLYVPLPDVACSDIEEPLCIVRQGYRVVFEDRALAYEESTKTNFQEFRMRVRVCAHGIAAVVSQRDLLMRARFSWVSFQLVSHKVLRWMVPVYLSILFLATAALANSSTFRYLFLLQLSFYLFGFASLFIPLHRLRLSLLGIPLYFCTINAAVLVGFFEVCRGHRFTIWDTARK